MLTQTADPSNLTSRLKPVRDDNSTGSFSLLQISTIPIPSGARRAAAASLESCGLRYNRTWRIAARTKGGRQMVQVKITVRRNGPFRVEAPEEIGRATCR